MVRRRSGQSDAILLHDLEHMTLGKKYLAVPFHKETGIPDTVVAIVVTAKLCAIAGLKMWKASTICALHQSIFCNNVRIREGENKNKAQ